MPPRRQLPWATKGGGSKSNRKQPPAKRPVPSDIDDDFFDGTILESSRKGKERANVEDSDVELPDVSSSRFAPTTRKQRESSRDARLPSSSPPPIAADLPPPETEYMLTGVDKFDLRDDEWMMVEDELLQTVKLFTQHLHLAEYETLKTKIGARRKEAAARPVVANAKPSTEGHFKRKAQEQTKKQKKALREVISTHDSSNEGDEDPQRVVPNRSTPSFSSPRPSSTTRALGISKPLQTIRGVPHENASDSDDLDALMTKPSAPPPKASADKGPVKEQDVFVKPAIPSKTPNKPAHGQRRNLWDDWDELATNPKTSISAPSPLRTPDRASSFTKTIGRSAIQQSPSRTDSLHTPSTKPTDHGTSIPSKRLKSTMDEDDLNKHERNTLAKDIPDRATNREARKDRDDKKKQKYDDIPTFLF
ncbi:uncharacterized protein N0V89_006289 [Didymosphaeria variabile]|uniref:Uncharacterized protein n=1 Tax=Didymosphaeria variabile TaxID=1932322 RepID=A0A9W8XM94_9PLEO|nr:uncharacterized protein N0V89_006289 [Didymosphaeria variabile]KAJ4354552.1 hypothetical protein N0V89_006289 [Didymosphaeria variabile]